MIKKSKTLLFFGNERLATGVTTTAPTLQKLIAAGYDITAVVANYERGKSRNVRELEVAQVAQAHGIPVLLPENLAEATDQLSVFGAEAAVLVAYGKIVPQSIIDLFPKGIINIHPSLLPLHRGPTPIESVILDGSTETGVSLMQLAKKMDAGPVFAQQTFNLSGTETKSQLAHDLLELGGTMLVEHLPAILEGTLKPKPQDEHAATYDQMIAKEDGAIDWDKSARQLEREVRAYAEWPKSRAKFGDIDVVITSSSVVTQQIEKPGSLTIVDNRLIVACGEDSLAIDRLKPSGKQEMTAQAFLAGYGKRLN